VTTIQLSSCVNLEICDEGEGDSIVLIPSWARDIRDFDNLSAGLVGNGFRCISVNPRGVGGSTGPTDDMTLFDWAEDIAGVIDALKIDTAHIAGHGHGNRVARCLATRWEEKVGRIVLLTSGGMINPSGNVLHVLHRALSEDVSDEKWCHLMRESGFFAKNSDPMVWRTGWWKNVMEWQNKAGELSPCSGWWSAGNIAPILVLHGLEDTAAPISNARLLKEKLPERTTLIELEDAGHALLPEVPDKIMQAMIDFLTN
jgi:pimeloyl-ACP methyl ester carboxylesterase